MPDRPEGAHVLTIEWTTPRDFVNGGFSYLVAQCACGSYDYVASSLEGAYWHELHKANPRRHGCYLLLRSPMPTGWQHPIPARGNAAIAAEAARLIPCGACSGLGHVERYGAARGHFYNIGERGPCDNCSGLGEVPWVDPHEGFTERLLAALDLRTPPAGGES